MTSEADRYSTPYGPREVLRDGKPFVTIHGSQAGEYVSPEEVDDFARLMAAAPALRDALAAIIRGVDDGWGSLSAKNAAIDAARAALRKAGAR